MGRGVYGSIRDVTWVSGGCGGIRDVTWGEDGVVESEIYGGSDLITMICPTPIF